MVFFIFKAHLIDIRSEPTSPPAARHRWAPRCCNAVIFLLDAFPPPFPSHLFLSRSVYGPACPFTRPFVRLPARPPARPPAFPTFRCPPPVFFSQHRFSKTSLPLLASSPSELGPLPTTTSTKRISFLFFPSFFFFLFFLPSCLPGRLPAFLFKI